jgi:hypothetical protein
VPLPYPASMADDDPVLVRVELSFRTVERDDPGALGDRIREATAMIVGRDALEEFRVRTLPLTEPERRGGLRPVD